MLGDGFRRHVAQRPGAPALVWHGESMTYGELGWLAEDARSQVAALGPGGGRPIAVVARKTPEIIARVLGCLLARRPAFLPSPDLPEAALAALIERSRVRVDAALLLTTSGSTGTPKIVPLTDPAIGRFAHWAAARFGIRPGTTVLSYAPLNFDLSLLDVWTTLERGGCVALVDHDRATRPGHVCDVLSGGVDVVQGVPMLYRLLLDRGRSFDRVAHAIVTGDRMPAAAVAALPRLFPRARIYNVYGCTETNDSFIHELDLKHSLPTRPLPIGTPLPGVQTLLLSDDGAIVEGAGSGELAVATPFQTAGYLDAALDDGRFMELGGRRYFRTGDLVRRDVDGVVTLEGRRDGFVKVRGVRVCLPAVEDVIAGHPDVAEVAVVAVRDDLAGHRLHAVVRRRDGSALNSLSIRRHCARRLERAAIPSTVEVVGAALPRTTTGKADRRRILAHPTEEHPS
jgi:acyl-coenzyme A synthetase/AMP-(fatty) acid ligase